MSELAEITIAECAENKPIGINSVFPNNFDIKEIALTHLPNGFDKEKLKTILIDCYDRIRNKNVGKSTTACERTIKLYDDTPVTSKPRTIPYAYQSGIFK